MAMRFKGAHFPQEIMLTCVPARVRTSWLFVTFGDSGSRKHNCHERGEGGELENPTFHRI
jgi:hypothetical protein